MVLVHFRGVMVVMVGSKHSFLAVLMIILI